MKSQLLLIAILAASALALPQPSLGTGTDAAVQGKLGSQSAGGNGGFVEAVSAEKAHRGRQPKPKMEEIAAKPESKRSLLRDFDRPMAIKPIPEHNYPSNEPPGFY